MRRKIEIHIGLKEDLLNRNAVDGLRLDISDPVHARRQRILAVGRNTLLHLRRAEPSILPNDGYDRDVNLGKDIGRHRQDGRRAEEQDERGEHIEVCGSLRAKRTIPMMVDLRDAILDPAISSGRSPSLRRRASASSKSSLDRRGESQTNSPARAVTDQWGSARGSRHVSPYCNSVIG